MWHKYKIGTTALICTFVSCNTACPDFKSELSLKSSHLNVERSEVTIPIVDIRAGVAAGRRYKEAEADSKLFSKDCRLPVQLQRAMAAEAEAAREARAKVRIIIFKQLF